MKYIFFYDTILGKIAIGATENDITHLYFENEKILGDFKIEETAILKKAALQLQNYLIGQQYVFDLPIFPKGTEFMQTVWKNLEKIPYGETRSYKEIACAVGNCKAARAVGLANNRNPVPIFIPCHRVIGSNGKLIGYSSGLEIKEKLLKLEAKYVKVSLRNINQT